MSVSSLPPELTATLAQERPQDAARVQALIERAFGPGRFAKSAERLREGNRQDLALSFVAWAGEQAVGSIRLWPVLIGSQPAILLGPFAVDDAWRSRGLGGALVERALQAVQAHGHSVVLLVGDEPFFRKYGFAAVPTGQIALPGPVDGRRVLWRLFAEDSPPPSGAVKVPPRAVA
jgi:predicted N-acetyltransferase YhbS